MRPRTSGYCTSTQLVSASIAAISASSSACAVNSGLAVTSVSPVKRAMVCAVPT
jgi:hypothetical protein